MFLTTIVWQHLNAQLCSCHSQQNTQNIVVCAVSGEEVNVAYLGKIRKFFGL